MVGVAEAVAASEGSVGSCCDEGGGGGARFACPDAGLFEAANLDSLSRTS